MKRRSFINKSFWGITGLGFLSGMYSWQIEPFWVEFVKLKMPIKNLPDHLAGKRLMQISDIHIGKRFDYQYIIKSFEKAKQYHPDFVVYTGDFVTTHKDEVQYADLEQVLKTCVQGKLGTIGILGNHDYGKNFAQEEVADRISEILKTNGIQVLRNEQLEIEELNFVGFDDYWGTNFNPNKVMKEYNKEKANLVLCHNPDVCDLDLWNGHEGWILSGHTHGGQVKPPFLDAPIVPVKNKRYTSGKFDLTNGKTLYINRALGHLWQIRFNTRPEITIFELEKG
jgi:predicted MPP superfamily phosphohydrolase